MGTTTEINDYLRLLYARVGTPYCINGHGAINASSVEQIVDKVLELPERQRLQILAPVIRKKKKANIRMLSRRFRKTDMFVSVWMGKSMM